MLRTAVVLVALGAVGAGRGDDPEPPRGGGEKAELRKLKGTWTVARAMIGKREVKTPAGLTYTFDGDKLTWSRPVDKDGVKQVQTYKVKLDTKKRPYKITMRADGLISSEGIFKIEKGELYLATIRTGKPAKAPADFTGDGVVLEVMTKE